MFVDEVIVRLSLLFDLVNNSNVETQIIIWIER